MIRQCHGRVEGRAWQPGQKERRAREEDRRGLAYRAFESQDDARKNAGHGFFQHDAANGLPARRAEGDAHSAKRLWNCAERFFRGADDDGQGHDGKRERRGEDGGAEVQEENEESQPEQSIYNGWDTRKINDRDADRARERRIGGVLRKINRGGNPKRNGEDRRANGEIERADDRGKDSACAHPVMRKAREELKRDGGEALRENVDHGSNDWDDGCDRHQGNGCEAESLDGMTVAGEEFGHRIIHKLKRYKTSCKGT